MKTLLSLSQGGRFVKTQIVVTYQVIKSHQKRSFYIRFIALFDAVRIVIESYLKAVNAITNAFILLSFTIFRCEKELFARNLSKAFGHFKRVVLFCYIAFLSFFSPRNTWKTLYELLPEKPKEPWVDEKKSYLALIAKKDATIEKLEQERADLDHKNRDLETKCRGYENDFEEMQSPTFEIFERNFQSWQECPSQRIKCKLLSMYGKVESALQKRQKECLNSKSDAQQLVNQAWDGALLLYTKRLHDLQKMKIALNS